MSVVMEREQVDDENTSCLKKAKPTDNIDVLLKEVKRSDVSFRYVAACLEKISKLTGQKYDSNEIVRKWIDVVTNKSGEGLVWQNLHAQLELAFEFGASGTIQATRWESIQILFFSPSPVVQDIFFARAERAKKCIEEKIQFKDLPKMTLVLESCGVAVSFPEVVKQTHPVLSVFLHEFFRQLSEIKVSIKGF